MIFEFHQIGQWYECNHHKCCNISPIFVFRMCATIHNTSYLIHGWEWRNIYISHILEANKCALAVCWLDLLIKLLFDI